MDIVALALWIMTAVGGLYMAGIALYGRRNEAGQTTSNLPSAAIFGHGFLALAGLAAFAVFMGMGGDIFGWSIVGLLVLVFLGGAAMFLVWTKDRHGAPAKVAANKERLSEQQIPSAVVHLHGALAALTMVAVVLTVLGVATGTN